jgi:hypothetical protein
MKIDMAQVKSLNDYIYGKCWLQRVYKKIYWYFNPMKYQYYLGRLWEAETKVKLRTIDKLLEAYSADWIE